MPIHGVLGSEFLKSSEDAKSDGSVAGLCVQNKIDEPIFRLMKVADDESPGVEALTDATADLFGICVAHHIDFNNRSSDVGFANSDEILAVSSTSRRTIGYSFALATKPHWLLIIMLMLQMWLLPL
jgi:hypothetical protein